MLKVKKNDAPKLKVTPMNCDNKLDVKLENYEVTKYLNTHTANIILGRQGSGKSSFLYSFLSNKKLMKGIFHNIFLFIPPSSLASFSDNCLYRQLDEEKILTSLTVENLEFVINYINDEPENNHMIIIDDMGSALKDKEIQKMLEKCIANMRHMHTSIYFMCQKWISLPRSLRSILSNLILFNLSKSALSDIFDEMIPIDKKYIPDIKTIMTKQKYSFLFYNINSNRLFCNFDEILLPEDI